MIKKVLLSLVLGVFLVSLIASIGFVSAGCDDNQTILRLYNQNNSHAQVYNYGEGVCVNNAIDWNEFCGNIDLEGFCGDPAPNCIWKSGPNKCVVNESKIMRDCLSFTTASTCLTTGNAKFCLWQSGVEYDYEVCYDEIFGASYSGAEPHPATCEKPVLWLYDYTNSHASVPLAQPGSLWSEVNKTYTIPICYGDLICRYTEDPDCGDKEKLVVRLYKHPGSENLGLAGMNSHVSNAGDDNYAVKVCCKSGSGLTNASWQDLKGNEIRDTDLNDTVKLVATGIGLDTAGTKFVITKKRGSGIFDIFIPDKRIDTLTSDTGIATWRATQQGKYKFKAVLSNTNEEFESEILNVSNVINDTPPIIEISSPVCNYTLILGGPISVSLQLDDPDDYIYGTLDLGDGTKIEVDNSAGDTFIYEHLYTASGNMHIELLTRNERSRTIKRVSNIMVIDPDSAGNYLAACVDKPEDLAFIPDAEVRFIAKSTRAIEYTPVADDQDPMAGITDLNIEDVLRESWKFKDHQDTVKLGLGYDFTYVFASPGNNWAELKVEFV